MSKSVRSLFKTGNAFLSILMILGLMIFNLVPTLAAPTPQTPLPGAAKNLTNNNGVEALAAYRPPDSPAEVSTRIVNLRYQAGRLSQSLPPAAQGANFVVNYNPAGNCQTTGLRNFIPAGTISPWPQDAKNAFEHALSIWAMVLNANQTIVINACWVNPGSANPLGTGQPVSVFADFTGAPVADTIYPVALANELAGSDQNDNDGPDHDGDGNDADAEITVAFNSTTNWYLGTNANPSGGQKDFVTVALHEIAHGLGFASTMFVNTPGVDICETGDSSDGQGCWGLGFPKPIIYDRFLENSAGDNLVQTYSSPSLALATQLTGTIYFSSTNAIQADAGTRPQLYTPNTFDIGSSILHLDDINRYKNSPNRLMTPFAGLPQHHPGPITLGIFKDMGWNINDLPLATFAKSTSVSTVQAGQALTYTLTVTNTGYLMMTNVIITDTVPVSTTLDLNSLNGGTASGTTPGSLITWTTLENLSTGNVLSRTFAVTVSLGAGVPTLTNTAFVTSSTGVGANATVLTMVTGSNNNVYLPLILFNQN